MTAPHTRRVNLYKMQTGTIRTGILMAIDEAIRARNERAETFDDPRNLDTVRHLMAVRAVVLDKSLDDPALVRIEELLKDEPNDTGIVMAFRPQNLWHYGFGDRTEPIPASVNRTADSLLAGWAKAIEEYDPENPDRDEGWYW